MKTGAEISIDTPDSSEYIIVQNLTKSISDRLIDFEVQSCKNAYVGLISGNADSDPLYEIVIEEGWNPDSYIRIGRDNSGSKFSEISEYLLHCNFYIPFRITWNDRTINLFISSPKNPFWDRILTWTSVTNLWSILNVGICTMDKSTGKWLFNTSDLPTTSDETTALLESTTAGITRPPQITTANHLSTSTDGHPGKPKTSDETTALLESTTLDLTRPPSTITHGKWTRPLTYTSTDSLTMYDETTQLPQTTRPDNMTTTSEDLPYRITNDDTVISDTSSASTSTKSTAMKLNLVTTPSSMSISVTKPGTGTFNRTCTCHCLDVPNTADNSVLVNQLKIDKKTLSSYKRRLQSATDPRKSSLYIGCVGIVVFSVTVAFIVILDFLPNA
ncbi:Hypothetical predicted protein [Mytilus galloprovincialis]|uniref:Farnesoic acid O-methyl transferase domain-containing protein n=1 Tax=Mytilus galloprovincialis TaxID=29158 RepID=A0A8B6FS91_MYTGA|nr:Hypothetical predicted protein [Mytilus galloprovincialis]